METAIQVVWWIGLVGALIGTLVVLKEVALVLRTLHKIYRLAEFTRKAAEGIVSNVDGISHLAKAEAPAEQLAEAAKLFADATKSFEDQLDAVTGRSRVGGE